MIKIQIIDTEKKIINQYLQEFNLIVIDNIIEFGKREDADLFLDKLSDLLCEKGLDRNDNLNELGNNIENLIDKVSRKLYV